MPAAGSSHDATIKEILRLRFPSMVLYETVAAVAKSMGNGEIAVPAYMAQMEAEREKLLQLAPAELAQTLESLRAKEKADHAARQAQQRRQAAEKAAAKFYNQPAAAADFALWTKADFWSFDEALALLLGKEPKVVTWAALKQELEHRARFERESPLPSFLNTYQRLRTLALRADAMTRAARLRPAEVIQWAQRVDLIEVPAALCGLSMSPSQPVSQVEPVEIAPTSGTKIKKAALLKRYATSWPTVHSDLAHASENGLAKAAKAVSHGYWNEEAAIHWAKQNGKMDAAAPDRALGLNQLPRRIHRLGD